MNVPDWYSRMNQRERMLAAIVGGTVFLLLNLFFWSWILGAINRGQTELAERKASRQQQAIFLQERDLWTKREQWLQQHQPIFKGAGEASTLLDQQLRPVADKYTVLIENPQIGSGESTPTHQSVWASIETKSHWDSMVHFLYDVQQPEAFIVFENVNLAIDSGDPTMMRGKFKVARWFAPTQPKKGG
jgi:hypothetical protein